MQAVSMRTPPTWSVHPSLAVLGACCCSPRGHGLGTVWFSSGNQVASEAGHGEEGLSLGSVFNPLPWANVSTEWSVAVHTRRTYFKGDGESEASICVTARSTWPPGQSRPQRGFTGPTWALTRMKSHINIPRFKA